MSVEEGSKILRVSACAADSRMLFSSVSVETNAKRLEFNMVKQTQKIDVTLRTAAARSELTFASLRAVCDRVMCGDLTARMRTAIRNRSTADLRDAMVRFANFGQ